MSSGSEKKQLAIFAAFATEKLILPDTDSLLMNGVDVHSGWCDECRWKISEN